MSDQEIIVGALVVFVVLAVASLFNSVLFGMYRDKQESLKPKTGIRKHINGEWVTEWSESK